MLKINKHLLIAFAVLLSFSACKKDNDTRPDDQEETEKTFSFLVRGGNPEASYLLQVSSLTEGTASISGNGVETNYAIITARNGFFYAIDNDSGNLIKFTSDNRTNTVVKEIPFNQIGWAYYSSFYAWKDDQTLVLFSNNASLQFEYAILNVETMTISQSGNIDIPAPPTDYYYWGNNVAFVGNKLFISYTHINNSTDVPENKTYLASIDYPAMDNIIVSSDSRFNYPSPYNLNAPGAFTENGNAYFLTSPTIWATSITNSPYGIYRVKSGTTEIDDTYFYELTDRTKEETIGLFSIGDGKAIVKILDKTQLSEYDDYSTKAIADYYVVDVVNQTKTKIDIPRSKNSGSYVSNVIVDDEKAYIVANAGDGFYVYEFDPATSAVKKGLKIEGISSLSRIDRMK